MNVENHQAVLGTFKERLRESERFHMGVGKVHETLETLTEDLDRAGIEYAATNAMALNAHGYRRETVDVDVLVRREGLRAFVDQYVGKGYRPAFEGARKSFRNTRTGVPVEFLTTGEYPGDGKPKPVAFPDPADVALDVQGAKVVNLPTLVNLKLASGMTQPARRRDLAEVQDLIRTLDLDEGFADELAPYVRNMFLTLVAELRGDDPHAEAGGST